MSEEFEGDVGAKWRVLDASAMEIQSDRLSRVGMLGNSYLCDAVVQPLCALFPKGVAVISVVVTRHMLQDIMHFLR